MVLKTQDDKVSTPIQFHTNSVQGISMQMIFIEVGRVTNVQNTPIIAGHETFVFGENAL